MKILIVRDKSLSDANGTYGRLSIDGKPFCATCEQPWNNNLANHSCIPVGEYVLIPYQSPAHGPTVVFHNPALGIYGTPEMIPKGVSGRSLCEIHNANWPFQVKGCIAVGRDIVDIAPHGLGVTGSVATLAELTARWGNRTGMTASVQEK
ncbi:DUF5675 family protein [Undibacterium terreum]|uniref:DUF5675 domain-containing protein n=1 Tax=Undibacterium terreum TaxID=1224302 RepID=A0A916XGZ6_9BURK|nr:DUF5675 family protein [Undibacterium terreum]GGC71336.1 hypothetical protein GCM10011396_18000 [Undibacterium terreum]